MQVQLTPVRVMVGAYLVGFGMLAGIAIDHLLYDRQRSVVLRRYEHALAQWHAQHMLIEKATLERSLQRAARPDP